MGWAFWSSTSQIALRLVSSETGRTAPDERQLFSGRLGAAAAYRASLGLGDSAYRLVHGEADRLPGLVVDRYVDDSGQYLVVQTLSQGADRRLSLLVDLLVTTCAPRGILVRNDPKVRRLEGLDEQVGVAYGEVPGQVSVREGAVTLQVDLVHGQKTGMFLDQRENHVAAARYARGRVLDAFTYNGGFALQMAAGADAVLALDSSAAAVAATRGNAQVSGISNVEVREANVFDELRELATAGATFDVIVLDPPAFAKNRAALERAAAGYKEINLRAMRLLAPGGHLITCSCSYNVSEAMLLDVVGQAAVDARRTMALVEKRMQARDHPVLLSVPETYYLKCLVLRRVD
jgi:23S rRNA (cytosine1962-C5)-methyltransferase